MTSMRGFVALLALAATLPLLLFMSQPDPPLSVVELVSGGYADLSGADCEIANFAQLKKVAVVYTWVNGSEPCYNTRRRRAGLSPGGSSRDKEMGELKYSIRSLLKFAPWLEGPIYIVTPGQIPDWLDVSNPRIKVIDQDELLPKDRVALPNFDTNVIEQFLHKIPGITDTFIHMNDDYLFVKLVAPQRFFTCDGGLRFLTEINHIRHVKGTKSNAWLASVRNTVQLMDKTYGGEHVYNFLKHAPFVYSKRAFEKIHEKFNTELQAMQSHQLRHYDDLNMPLLHHIYMSEEGSRLLGIPFAFNPIAECDDWLLIRVTDNDHADLETRFALALANKGPEVLFALNDEYSEPETAQLVTKFYEAMLPERARHELPTGHFAAIVSNYNGPDCAYDPALLSRLFPSTPKRLPARYASASFGSLRRHVVEMLPLHEQQMQQQQLEESHENTRRFRRFFKELSSSELSLVGNFGFLVGVALGVVCVIYVFRLVNEDLFAAAARRKSTKHISGGHSQ